MNQYNYSAPFTEQELYRDYLELRMSQVEIAAKYGTTQKVVWRAMKKMGISSRVAAKRNQRGSLNSGWKGGRVLAARAKNPTGHRSAFGNGYYYIKDSRHPNANKTGYVAEHVVVATRERGTPLKQGEMVHHLDLHKHNNNPGNLIICSAATHAQYHNQLELIAASLLKHGLIRFSAERGYEQTDDLREFVLRYRGH